MTAADGELVAQAVRQPVPAELGAPLANMLQSALAAWPPPARTAAEEVVSGDTGGSEGHLSAPGPDSGGLPAPVDHDAGPRARRVHCPAVRAVRRSRPAGLARRPDR